MRRLAVPVAFLAALLLPVMPASGQSVSDLTLQISNPAGPISACPATVNFVATVAMNWPATTPIQNRTIQYKWTNSAGIDEPTQTAVFFTPGTLLLPLTSIQIKNAWKVNAGTYWEALQITYPVNLNSPPRVYAVTCPTLGTLSFPATLGGASGASGLGSGGLLRP